MQAFEITASGFDGGTDETDDRVLWVMAPTQEEVTLAIEDLDASCVPIPHIQAQDADYTLPGDLVEFQRTLRKFFLSEKVPAKQFSVGVYPSATSEAYTGLVTIYADTEKSALAAARLELDCDSDGMAQHVRLLAQCPNPRYLQQLAQIENDADEKSAQRSAQHEALELACRDLPVYRLQVDLEFRNPLPDDAEIRKDAALHSWVDVCCSCNTNRVIPKLFLREDARWDAENRLTMKFDLRLTPGREALSISDLPSEASVSDWVSACLNVNPNRVVASVSLLETLPGERFGLVDDPKGGESIPRPRGA
jgi:hypothetical protein